MNAPPTDDATSIAQWRNAERKRLRAARLVLSMDQRDLAAQAIATELDQLVAEKLGDPTGHVISGYWPIKSEPSLIFWMEALHARGVRIALPVVEVPHSPLVFRAWHPGARMERGHWNIPVPTSDAVRLVPEIALAPLVGWDPDGYRLGYGGGYFDRTLATITPRPYVIGVGLQASRIPTIVPQAHDIRLDCIVTEQGRQ